MVLGPRAYELDVMALALGSTALSFVKGRPSGLQGLECTVTLRLFVLVSLHNGNKTIQLHALNKARYQNSSTNTWYLGRESSKKGLTVLNEYPCMSLLTMRLIHFIYKYAEVCCVSIISTLSKTSKWSLCTVGLVCHAGHKSELLLIIVFFQF